MSSINEVIEGIDAAEYAALTTGAAFHSRDHAGVLVVSDADRSDFLHRMTTANINALAAGQSAVTVLTSPTARILFVFTVVCRAQDLILLPAPGQAQTLERHLRGQIFFMDKVKVQNVSADYARLRIMGPQAEAALAKLGWTAVSGGDSAWAEHGRVMAVRQLGYDVPGIELILPAVERQVMWEGLSNAGVVRLEGSAAYTARRIELGRSAPRAELVEAYNPLEAGLAWACADNKGCYTGQEIIARQLTYDKVTKTLVGLVGERTLTAGVEITRNGSVVGTVTSATFSPALGKPLALAIVKRPADAPGTDLFVGDIPVHVIELPDMSE